MVAPSYSWFSFNKKTATLSSPGYTIQYSATPASSYNSYLIFTSFLELPGESISTIRSGDPQQPFASSFESSHTTQMSGCTTVVTSLSFFLFLMGSRTSNGAEKALHDLPFKKLPRLV